MGLRCKHPWSPRAFCFPFIPPFNVYLIVFNSAISIPRHFHLAGNSLLSLGISRWKLKLVLTSEKANFAQILESKLNYLRCHCTIVFFCYFPAARFSSKNLSAVHSATPFCAIYFSLFLVLKFYSTFRHRLSFHVHTCWTRSLLLLLQALGKRFELIYLR